MHDIKPCLWFRSEAEEAANYYVGIFPGSTVGKVLQGPPGAPAVAVEFVIDGAPFLALNGRPEAGFTDAASYLVSCDTQAEIDRYWAALTADGGEEGQCGWLKDRYGVSWQIAPRAFASLFSGPDAAANGRAMQAMMRMRKIDIAAIERARDGAA